MRARAVAFAVLLAALFATIALAPSSARADATPEGRVIVARVGDLTITADDLERRLASVPPFQLRTLGRTPDEIRKTFLEKVLIREALFAEGARAHKAEERDDVRERIRGVLRGAMMSRIRLETQAKPVTDADVKAYYDQNKGKFHAPARIGIWRIQVNSAQEAKAILDELGKDESTKKWNDIAREKSVDKMTNQRGGNLGFIQPDGSTDEPSVKVDPALFDAAMHVKDGDRVPEPVKDNDKWSVVWRRQSMRQVDRPLEQEAPSIKQILTHQHAEEAIQEQLKKLHERYVTEYTPELLEFVQVNGSGDLAPPRRPGTLPNTRRTQGAAQPRETPGGLR